MFDNAPFVIHSPTLQIPLWAAARAYKTLSQE
jgi:hypothetical protein